MTCTELTPAHHFHQRFEIDHDKVEAFLQGWRDRAEFMSKQPGFGRFGCIER